MRWFKLVLLGAIAYVVSVLFMFPAAPVLQRIEPNLQPIKLSGVDGKLFRGSVARINYDDDVFPVELTEANWKLLPRKLLAAAVGVNFDFKAYGGLGDGDFERKLNGDMRLSDVRFTGPAKGLEALLPLPVASFAGQFALQVEVAELENNLLTEMVAKLDWSNAVLETPIALFAGTVSIDIQPVDAQTHRAAVTVSGGEVDVQGSVDVKQNGDFVTDFMVKPEASASPDVINALRGLGRPDNQGRYRLQQNGNVNRLM